jgi:hypothetical protein
VVLWMAQALRALDRMTPNATTTKAQRAAATPADLTSAGNVLLASGSRWDGCRGAEAR